MQTTPRSCQSLFRQIAGMILCGFSIVTLSGVLASSQLHLTFTEVAQSADLVFAGTAERMESRFNPQGTFIITEVFFRDIQVVHSTQRSIQRDAATIILEHAGGCVGDICLGVSIAPVFVPGRRYLLFVNDDGGTYANPLIGGPQGMFNVAQDMESNQEYVLTAGGKTFYADEEGKLVSDASPVISIRNGSPVYETTTTAAEIQSAPPPLPHHPTDGSVPASALINKRYVGNPLTLEAFIHYIRDTALNAPLEKPLLRRNETGSTITTWNLGEEYPAMEEWSSSVPDENTVPATSSRPLGGTLGYCGYHTLPFVMQTVPTDWWSYDTFEAVRQTWNWFMAIYQKSPSDGKFGYNNTNEVCGWVKEADMQRIYGVGWNGYLGWAHSWWRAGSPCGRLLESDIMFNPAYDWTDSEAAAWGNDDLVLLRPVAMHEMAHTWGMQRGSEGQWGYYESYDYDQLSVVHSYYHDIIEDGRGIHVADAYCLRRDYQSRTNIKNTVDVGVESYYASNGLHNATADKSSYYPGDAITLSNITVENNGYQPAANVRIRVFLSTDRNITGDDFQVGSYWSWDTLARETRSVFNVNSTIPDNVPTGTYYIGIIITVNGLKNDDYTLNNRTTFAATIQVKVRSSGGDDGDGNGGGCFIATAAFGSPLAAQVALLSDFRDHFLMGNNPGRDFVRAYYRYSPPLARLISKQPPLKTVVRAGLIPLIAFSRVILNLKVLF